MDKIAANKFIPGLRIIKTAIGVGVCITILKLLTDDPSLYFYGAIAVIIVMQSTITNSVRLGYTRVLGSIIGSVIAYAFILIAQLFNLEIDNIILIMIALTLTIELCVLLKIPEAILVACILYLASVTLVAGDNFLHYIISRLLATICGILVSLVINYLFFKPAHNK